MKQHLNEIHSVDKLMKKVINDDNEKSHWLSQRNHFKLDGTTDDIK